METELELEKEAQEEQETQVTQEPEGQEPEDDGVQVVEINEGAKIAWEQRNMKLVFGDDDLSIRCDTRQRDWAVHLDICADKDKNLVIGVGVGRYYVAQVDIPPVKYRAVSGDGAEEQQEAEPLDMRDVTLTLWSIDDLQLAE